MDSAALVDEAAVARWLEPLAPKQGDVAEVFIETRRRTAVEWIDGEPGEARVAIESGVSARLRRAGQERLAFVSGSGDAEIREALRALASSSGMAGVPSRPGPAATPFEADPDPSVDRWVRRLGPIFARHVARGRLGWSMVAIDRRVIPSGLPPARSLRRLFSLEGSFTAASRRGDETRAFSFHAPEADSTADEVKLALTAATAAREQPVPFGDARADVLFSGGTAAVLFHEILSHALEAGAEESPLSRLTDARVSVSDLVVRDDPSRLDLFGGYERDDEGTRPRVVKLLDSGRLGGPLSDRSHGARGSTGHGRRAGPADSPLPRGSNTVVSPGQATTEEILRRLSNGLWIDEISSGSVELASGLWRLRYPHARRVRRGRFADEVGPGILAGEILSTLSAVEPVIGREVRPYRSLGWCSRAGQVVPVQGAAPDVLVRRLSVRDR